MKKTDARRSEANMAGMGHTDSAKGAGTARAPRATRIRTCIACRKSAGKHELCRVVRTPGGAVELDASGKAPGRGAYVCYDGDCFSNACKRRLFAQRLRCKIDKACYERLESSFAAACARRRTRQVGMV